VEEVGGFFVSLKALVDESSFRKGISGVNDLAGSLKGLILGGAALLGISASIKSIIDTAAKQGQMLITAQQVNMSASALSQWEGVLAHVGGSMDAFSGAAGRMNEEFLKMDFGGKPPSDDFFLALGQLGIDVQKLKGEDSNARMQDILSHALSYSGPGGKDYARTLVRQLGGGMPGLESIFDYLQLPSAARGGATWRSLWNQSGAEQFVSSRDRAKAEWGSAVFRDTQFIGAQIWGKFASDLMGDLAPSIKSMNDWLEKNNAAISDLVTHLAELTGWIIKLGGGLALEPFKAATGIHSTTEQQLMKDVGHPGGVLGFMAGATIYNPFFNFLTNLGYDIMKGIGLSGPLGLDVNVSVKTDIPANVKATVNSKDTPVNQSGKTTAQLR